ncbi:MAG: AI-2E family transporter [Planctomycetota bacterium]
MSTPDGGDTRPEWARLHLWQIQPIRDILLIVLVLALLRLGQSISIVTVPLLLALLLAYLFEPVVSLLTKKNAFSRPGAVIATMALAILLVIVPLVGGLTFGAAQLVGLVGRVGDDVSAVSESLTLPPGGEDFDEQTLVEWRSGARDELRTTSGESWLWIRDQIEEGRREDSQLGKSLDSTRAWIQDNAEQIAQSVAQTGVDALRWVGTALGSVFGLGFMAFITAFFFYFVSTGWVGVKKSLTQLIPEAHKETAFELITEFDGVISGFIRGRVTIAFLQSIVFTAAYFAIGVPASFILGPVVAILSIVPYLALVGLPVSVLLLALESHDGLRGQWYWILGAPAGVYFLGQALDDYLWTPQIQGKETGMSTPAILFATLAGGALFGVFGLLIAIPIAACLKIVTTRLIWPRVEAWLQGRRGDALPIDGG